MVIYTDMMPKKFAGYNIGPVTLIRPSYKNDKGIHAHEEVHRQQFLRNPFMGVMYLLSKESRLNYEAEAYAAQLSFNSADLPSLAFNLATKYDLDITVDEAKAAILRFVKS